MSEMSGRCTTRAPTSSSPSTKAPSRTTTRWSALHTRRASTSRPDSPSACRRCRRSRSTPAASTATLSWSTSTSSSTPDRARHAQPPTAAPLGLRPGSLSTSTRTWPHSSCAAARGTKFPALGVAQSSRRSARPRRRTACGAGCAATSRAGPGNSARRSVASRSTTRRPSRPAPAGPRRPGPPTSTAAAACCSPPGPANRGPAAPRTRGAAAVFGGGVAAGDAAVPSLGVGRTAVLDGRRLWVRRRAGRGAR